MSKPEAPMAAITLTVNGHRHQVAAEADTPLLYVLRNDLELNGPRFGCGLGQCGSCTVLVDGQPARSCITEIGALQGRRITTLEGLGTPDKLHALQRAFIAEQAAQCGYCANGMIMAAKALLDSNAEPSEPEIRDALAPYLCRCGTHNRIVAAVQRAVREG
jgi:nicotinate dehydrogenase subunit A